VPAAPSAAVLFPKSAMRAQAPLLLSVTHASMVMLV